jgi:hypothetical protein
MRSLAERRARDPLDIDDAMDYLLDSFEESSDGKQEYRAFCDRRGFPADLDDPDEAAVLAFATQALGIDLATVSIQAGTTKEDAQKVLHALARFARANDLIIDDPQLGAEVDLDDPGKRPVKRS